MCKYCEKGKKIEEVENDNIYFTIFGRFLRVHGRVLSIPLGRTVPINYCLMCRKEAGRVKRILDACCGSKMFWFDKNNKNTIYMDNRELTDILCDGRTLKIKPDVVGDFRNMPFTDDSFYLVVFDPPHLLKIGENSYMAKKYGKLNSTWKEDIRRGFKECMRVLKTNGTLIFKWNEQQIKLKEILNIIDYKPLFRK